jgi:hypothetical protein
MFVMVLKPFNVKALVCAKNGPVQWKSYSHPYCETQSIAHDFFSQFKVVHIVTWEKFTDASEWGYPDTSTAPLPMWYTSMGYTPMRYTSTALYFYTEHTQFPGQFFKLILQGKNVYMNILSMFYFYNVPLK